MTPTDAGTIVSTAFSGLETTLLTVAPALVGVGVLVFAVPFIKNWAQSLVR